MHQWTIARKQHMLIPGVFSCDAFKVAKGFGLQPPVYKGFVHAHVFLMAQLEAELHVVASLPFGC